MDDIKEPERTIQQEKSEEWFISGRKKEKKEKEGKEKRETIFSLSVGL